LEKLYLNITNIIKNPVKYFKKMYDDQRSQISESGKVSTLVETLRQYRENLPRDEEITEEERDEMTDEEYEAALPDPEINRHDILQIFKDTHDNGKELYDWIGDNYIDTIWLDVHKEFSVNTIEEENEAEAKRLILIHEAAAASLKHVLGLENTNRKNVSEEVMSVQQLFAPTTETLEVLTRLNNRVSTIEEQSATITHVLCKLDSRLTSVLQQLTNNSVSRVQQNETPAMPRASAQLPSL
jgi:hypothetical protein